MKPYCAVPAPCPLLLLCHRLKASCRWLQMEAADPSDSRNPTDRAVLCLPPAPLLLLCRRLKAYRKWLTMEEPDWSDNRYPRIDFQDLSYYSAPKVSEKKQSLDEVGAACFCPALPTCPMFACLPCPPACPAACLACPARVLAA